MTAHSNRSTPAFARVSDAKDEAARKMLAALREIAIGRGPYRIDPMEHAESVIEAMKEEARAAIAAARAAGIEE